MMTPQPTPYRPLSPQTRELIQRLVEETLTPTTKATILSAYTATYDLINRETRSSEDDRSLDPDLLRAEVIPAFAAHVLRLLLESPPR
jgi:hypothetical protein